MKTTIHELRVKAKGMTLLYVEDDEGIVAIFEEVLKMIFPVVFVARNGEEGLKLYKECKPDIVMTDIYMPKMDGVEMAKQIKTIDPEISIIVTSAYSQADEFLRSIEIGIDGYVIKPFTKERLFGAVNKVLDHIISTRKLKEYHELIENILIHVADGVIVTDATTKITLANPTLCKMMGYEADELIGMKPSLYKSNEHDQSFYEQMWQTIMTNGEWKGEVVNCRKNGEKIVVDTVIVALRNEQGEVISYIATCRDITLQKETMTQAYYQAMHDMLTGAYNRQYLQSMNLDESGMNYSLMMIDVDGFKLINDSYGHAVGDQVLIALASGFEEIVRKSDVVIRYGGDEFMVILKEMTDKEMIEKIAKRMIAYVEELNGKIVKDIVIGVSIGIDISKGERFRDVYERADKQMYRIKKEGKNNFSIAPQNT